ncbi:hypothetical protein [Rhizobium leguminosarum]|uniref:hypothetical protein n=1 Tax=Rhizobium leguminosarum TaxID=384 RepID=UPI00144109D4|nr:hypothetical protein [Rhizobium leguminosarum]NKL87328.1 hypothetical protein [Rhizobium leguminosarum bv. viciae]NKM94184.1 hypothetical protein [Rhizobium leguminosarum bv. viciae]
MTTLTGSSTEMVEQARKLTDAELTELAWMNDSPQALKARGELARRAAESGRITLRWARIAGWAGIVAVMLAVVAVVLQVFKA